MSAPPPPGSPPPPARTPGSRPPRVVLAGVAGSGKTTVGRLLAERLGVVLVDADDLHPPENRARMASGQPLDEAARAGWLAAVHAAIAAHAAAGAGFVLACSALRRHHRQLLAAGVPGLRFVHLRVGPAVLAERLRTRTGHFFPPSLLPSQQATWEELTDGIVVDGERPAAAVAAAIERAL